MHAPGLVHKPKSACIVPLFFKGREAVQEKKREMKRTLPSLREFELFRDCVYRADLEKYFRTKGQ